MSRHNEFTRNFAVIIGINNYQNSIRELITAVPDALKLAEIIQQQHEKLKPQYQSQNKYEVQLLLNQRASLSQLKQLIADFKQGQITLDKEKVTVTESDRLLFYFAGHGIALDALENQEGPVGYLIPQDAISGDSSTYLPMQELHDALNALPCRHMLAILDCCFAGAFRWACLSREIVPKFKVYKERYDRFISDRAWQVITSASDDQKALDSLVGSRGRITDGNEVHSPFAQALFDVLLGKGGDLNQDGMVTATELYSYLRDQVEIASENYYQRQTPSLCPLRKHDKGEFIFLLPDFDRDKLEDAPPLNVENNPYRGLSSYDEKDSSLFFGREEQIQKLYQKVVDNKQQLTLVLGASGTGKSSLVKAGLIPKLRKDDKTWRILPPFRPGESPLKSLNNVLESVKQPLIQAGTSSRLFTPAEESLGNWFKNNPQAKLLVVIDQFEELITLSKSEEAEKFQIFIKNILAKYLNNIHVVITLRLDFEAQFQTSVLNDFWNDDARFVVSPMSQNEFREAIEKPASQKVLYFDPPSLVDELINEVVQMPGALPLLSFTLSELYLKYLGDRTKDNRALTKKDYEELGRVVGSLTKRANQEYDQLAKENPAYQDTVRRVMLRMVSLQGGELARRQVPKSEFVYSDQEENQRVQTVIKRFSEARLIVEGSNAQGESYVEPAHDALVQGWDQLLAWKKENEENIILQRRLTPDAEEWKSIKGKFQPLGLQTKAKTAVDWFDYRLYTIENSLTKISAQFARLWRQSQNQQKHYGEKPVQFLWDANPYLDVVAKEISSDDNWLNQVEADFVEESVLQKRRNMSWRWRIAIAVMLGLSGLTIAALIGQRNAQIAQIQAFEQASDAEWQSKQVLEATLNALRAGKTLKNLLPFGIFKPDIKLVQVRGKLLQAVYGIKERNRLEGHSNRVMTVVFGLNGERIAASSGDGTVKVWKKNGILEPNSKGQGKGTVFSTQVGKILTWQPTFSSSMTIEIGRVDGTSLHTLKDPNDRYWKAVNSVVFSPDEKRIAVAYGDGTVKLWKPDASFIGDGTVKLWKPDASIGDIKHSNNVTSAVFSPNGDMIASASWDKTVKLWKPDGTLIRTLEGHNHAVISAVFSPNGDMIASASQDKTVKLWKPDGTLIRTLEGHNHAVISAVFSPNGDMIASASQDKTIKLWKLDGTLIHTLEGHNSTVYSVAFSPNGDMIASASQDNTVKLWQLDSTFGDIIKAHNHAVTSAVFSPNGDMIASASQDKTIKLWKPDGTLIHTLEGHNDAVTNAVFSPNGDMIASASQDKTIKLWKPDGTLIHTLQENTHAVNSVVFSPNGKMIASISSNGEINIWKPDSSFIRNLEGYSDTSESPFHNIILSPDSQMIASAGSGDGKVKLQKADGTPVNTLPGYGYPILSVAFSPDGQMIALGSFESKVSLWKPDGSFIRDMEGHDSPVNSVVFSADGQMIASASKDGTVKLWERNGALLSTLKGYDGYQQKSVLNFSTDGNSLVLNRGDGTVIVWNLNLDDLLVRGCNWMRDYLNNNPNVSESDRHLCDDVPPITTKPEN